jgi:Dodecin
MTTMSRNQLSTQITPQVPLLTLHGIHGIEVMGMTATVDANTGKIAQYRTGVKIPFGVEH